MRPREAPLPGGATGRRVLIFMSQMSIDPFQSVELFQLDHPLPESGV